jgi:hypothetical protein
MLLLQDSVAAHLADKGSQEPGRNRKGGSLMQDQWYSLLDPQTHQITGHFLQCLKNFLAAAQAGQQRQLQEDLQDRQIRLAHQEHLLEQAARDGLLWPTGSSLFLSQLTTWAEKEALKVALRYSSSLNLPAQEAAIGSTFRWQLAQEIQARWSALEVLHQQARQQQWHHYQEQAGQQSQYWQTVARQILEEQRQQQTSQIQWWTRSQQEAQQAQQHWANLAYQGIEAAQRGLDQQYHLAGQIHDQIIRQLSASTRQAEQAVQRATLRQWGTRGLTLFIILLAIGSLFGCAFIATIRLF